MWSPGGAEAAAQSSAAALSGVFPSRDREDLNLPATVIALYNQNRSGLYSYLVARGMGPDDAEDAIQESFVRLVEHLQKGLQETNLRAWLFRVAHNISMDVHRYSGRFVAESGDPELQPVFEVFDSASNPEQAYLRLEEFACLQARMSQLTLQQRNSVLLRAEGMRYREIATKLQVSLQRAADLVQKGLERLAVER